MKKLMNKRVLAVMLALVMVFAMSASAFASSDTLITSLYFQVSSKDPTQCTMKPKWGKSDTGVYTVVIPDYTSAIYFKASFDSNVCAAAKVDTGKLGITPPMVSDK